MSRVTAEKAQYIKDNLAKVFPTYVITLSDDAGAPVITVNKDASPATTEENAVIRLVQKSYTTFPIPSLASSEDGRPSLLQLVVEESAVAGVSVWSTANFTKLLARLNEQNIDTELYIRALGTVPVVADITSANFVAFIPTDVRLVNSGN